MNILITGVNGYVGRNTALALISAGHQVCGIDRADEPFDKRIDYMAGDITDSTAIENLFTRFHPDALIHFAALVHKQGHDLSRERYRLINATASEELFKAAAASGVSTILFSSTIEVYGAPDASAVNENTPCRPLSYYADSKLEAEKAMLQLINKSIEPKSVKSPNTVPARWAIMRFAPVYGPDFRLNLDKRFYLPGKRCMYRFRDGNYSFHFCSIGNICGFITAFLTEKGGVPSGVYNLSDSKPISANEFIASEKAYAKRKNRRLRSVRLPYSLSFAAIACAEFIFRLFSKSEPTLSRYNFKKLFRSTVYDSGKAWSAVGAEPRFGVETLYE